MATTLTNLNQRLQNIENKVNSTSVVSVPNSSVATTNPSFLQDVENFFTNEKNKVMTEVKTLCDEGLAKLKIDPNDLCSIINYVVEFVEGLTTNVPKIVQIVGGVFTGQYKFSMALELIYNICGSIASSLPPGLLGSMVNNTVALKYNTTSNSDGTTTTQINQTVSQTSGGTISTNSTSGTSGTSKKKRKVLGNCFTSS